MSVLESVERDLGLLAKRDKALSEGGLAATAKQLARELDVQGNSATSKAACAKSLLDIMDRLRELAPAEQEKDAVDDLARKRADRRSAAAKN